MIVAQRLKLDPKIQEAKKMILAAVKEHQKEITHVKKGDPERKQLYDDLIKHMGQMRGGSLFYPYIGSGIGNGALVELLDGSVKYDCISGIGVHLLGHSHPEVIAACIDASYADTVMQGNLQQNGETAELLEILTKVSGKEHCFLTTSGVMAVENGLKIAFQKRAPANRILAFEHCFAGRTISASQITDKPAFREGLPTTMHIDYIPFMQEESLPILRKHLARYPGQHALMIFELVQGEGGCYVGERDFFVAICKELRKHNILIQFDEVQTFARTTRLFAFQHFGLEEFADIVTIGKAAQICATLFDDEIKPRPGLLSQTFTGSTSMIFASAEIIRHLLKGNYYGAEGKIAKIHSHFLKLLQEIEKKHPDKLSGPYGVGVMVGFTPFEGDPQKVLKLSHDLFEAGIITFVAGSDPTRLRFLLPVVAAEKDLNAIAKILEEVLTC